MTLYNLYKLAVLLNCVLLLARVVLLLLVRGFCVRRKLLTGGFNVQFSIVILQCHSFYQWTLFQDTLVVCVCRPLLSIDCNQFVWLYALPLIHQLSIFISLL